MRYFYSLILAAFIIFGFCLPSIPATGVIKVAFIGDSITTGAVTHPALAFDNTRLWRLVRGAEAIEPDLSYLKAELGSDAPDRLVGIQRLWPGIRDFFNPSDWFNANILHAFARIYLDVPSYSWAGQLTAKLGLEEDEVVMAAQDGARMRNAIAQLDTLLDKSLGVLPERTFVFFTGNDLCSHSYTGVTSRDEYGRAVERFLSYLVRNSQASVDGSDVYFISYLGILQLTGNESILEKKIYSGKTQTTCRQLLQEKIQVDEETKQAFLAEYPEAALFWDYLPTSPASFCPTVYEKNFDKVNDQRVSLANRIRSFREVTAAAIAKSSKKDQFVKKNIRLHVIDGTADLLFEGKDIANDCFHLSVHGQNKIMKVVQGALNL